MTMLRSVVLGCGSYLPSRVLTNAELSRMVDTTDEWITQRNGIRERRIAAEGETTSDMALKAAQAALAAAGLDAQSIDLIVLATHGRTGIKRLVIGNVAEKVVRHAPCPVLTVKARAAVSGDNPA